MKAATIKTFLDVHTWTGLAAGLALFIAFYTGAITVFMHELEIWDAYTDDASTEQTSAQAQDLIDLVVLRDPGAASAFRLYPSSDDHPGHSLYWFDLRSNQHYIRDFF